MTRAAITFDASARNFILDVFGKAVDPEGFIVEKENQGDRVLTPEGDVLRAEDFAGVHKGSLVFVRAGIMSAVRLSDRFAE